MARLIATMFDYRHNSIDGGKLLRGSYLGRSVASLATLRRFVNRNVRDCHLDRGKLTHIEIIGSHVSPWISK